jgi:predicted HicB family RNase H-like nuclease
MVSTQKKKKRTSADAVIVFSRVSRALHKLIEEEARRREIPLSVLVREKLERMYGIAV